MVSAGNVHLLGLDDPVCVSLRQVFFILCTLCIMLDATVRCVQVCVRTLARIALKPEGRQAILAAKVGLAHSEIISRNITRAFLLTKWW